MPREYVPNMAAQGAMANAVRSYTPNQFSGTGGGTQGALAPHLSMAREERPFAEQAALMALPQQLSGGIGDAVTKWMGGERPQGTPDQARLDRMWNISGPAAYSRFMSAKLRDPKMAKYLELRRQQELAGPQPEAEYINEGWANASG